MTRYVISNRRAGRFRRAEKEASRGSLAATLARLPSAATLVCDNAPVDDTSRHTVILDVSPVDIARVRAMASDDVIVEPEILHHRVTSVPADFLVPDAHWLSAPLMAGDGLLEVKVTGAGKALPDATVQLFLRGVGGLQRQLAELSDRRGNVTFRFDRQFLPAALIVVPYANFWSTTVRGPMSGSTIDCLPLPMEGPGSWWHRAVGAARASRTRGRGIRVGVVDSGLGPHPALAHIDDVGSFIEGRFDPSGGSDSGAHGSHVNGIIGARPTEVGQYAGIAPGVRQFSARVFPPVRGANQMDISDAIDALSRQHAVDLINLSLGASVGSEIERDAIRDALERGTLCVCAAGNANGPVSFPAAFPETVAVSALGEEGRAPIGSQSANALPLESDRFGDDGLFLANFSDHGPEIDCAAPGVGILSTVPARRGWEAPFAALDGTSMASPLACGTLAVLLAKSDAYRRSPRDETRSALARRLLVDIARDIGLDRVFQGRGVPTL